MFNTKPSDEVEMRCGDFHHVFRSDGTKEGNIAVRIENYIPPEKSNRIFRVKERMCYVGFNAGFDLIIIIMLAATIFFAVRLNRHLSILGQIARKWKD